MLLGMLVNAAPASAAYVCTDRQDIGGAFFNGGEYMKIVVKYKYCVDPDPDKLAYVKPYKVIGSYEIAHSISCDPVMRKYDGARFNMYFWRPYTGTAFNPGAVDIPCDTSGMNSRTQSYDLANVPRLYFGPGYGDDRQPRWKANLTLRLNVANDEDRTVAKDFQP